MATVVRWLSLRDDPPLGRHWLSESENAYVARFLRADDRARSSAALHLSRLMLGNRTGKNPEDVRLERRCPNCGSSAHGRVIHNAGGPYTISISHSGDYVAVALSQDAALGIDLEHRGREYKFSEDLARWFLTPNELGQLPTSANHAVLLDWWCRKESVLKATGEGLSRDPRDIVVTAPGVRPRLLRGPAGLRRAQLFALDIPECFSYLTVVASDRTQVKVAVRPALSEPGWIDPRGEDV